MSEIKGWPIYFKKNLIIGNLESEVGVVSLWTPVSALEKKLDKNSYCLLGQLYSKEGINYIIRNILARPNIRHLIICGQELSGSGDSLIHFLREGIDDEYKVLNTEFAEVHKEIPREAVELFRRHITFTSLIGETDAAKIQEALAQYKLQGGGLFAEPNVYPDAVPSSPDSFPTDFVFKIRRKFIGEAWLEILKHIKAFGAERETFYGNKCWEIFNVVATVTTETPGQPKMFPFFQIAAQDIENYYPQFMIGERGTEVYTYGERLWNYKGKNQVEDILIGYLKKYPTDRAALAVTFDVCSDHTAERAPCLCLVQANLVNDRLYFTAYFRSHSIFSGWLLNAFGLRRVQGYVAEKLSAQVGELTIFSNAAHYYDNEYKEVDKIVEKYGKRLDCSPDPRGNFVITVEDKEIVAVQQSPEGKYLRDFRQDGTVPKAAQKLYNAIVMANGVSQVAHAFDLGIQIERAEMAVKYALEFRQDNSLELHKYGLPLREGLSKAEAEKVPEKIQPLS